MGTVPYVCEIEMLCCFLIVYINEAVLQYSILLSLENLIITLIRNALGFVYWLANHLHWLCHCKIPLQKGHFPLS